MKNFSQKISVIIPAYNEGSWIYNNLLELNASLEKIEYDFEIILVDDGSKDNTKQEAKRAASKKDGIKIVNYSNNMGKGYAIT